MEDIDELCCPICQESYDSAGKAPRMLSCGHTYCTMCLSGLFSRGDFSCPEDRSIVTAATASALPKNFALLRLLDRSPVKKDSSLCSAHKRPLEYVCLQEKMKVCASCALFGSHRGHNIKTVEETMVEVTQRAECLFEMLQLVESSQKSVLSAKTKSRMDSLHTSYHTKKAQLEVAVPAGFQRLQSRLKELEKQVSSQMQRHFEYFETHIIELREVPQIIDSQTEKWKDEAKGKLEKISQQSDDSSFLNIDFLDPGNSEIFQLGEKLIEELEALKGLELEPLEHFVAQLTIEFNEKTLEAAATLQPAAGAADESLPLDPPEQEPNNSRSFSEEVFNQGLGVLKFHTTDIADFSGAGELGDKAAEIALYLHENQYLKSLKLVKNSISDHAAVAIFKALESNSALQSLHLSQNSLGPLSLDALISMLNANSTLRDIYLIGNPRMTFDYKSKFSAMSSRFRKVYT